MTINMIIKENSENVSISNIFFNLFTCKIIKN
jgi:hypothetical protein